MPGKRKDARTIQIQERRLKALELRKRGMSLRAIAETLNVKDPATIFRDIQAALDMVRQEIRQSAEELVAMDVERLDDLLATVAPQIEKGSLAAVDRALRILDQRARLLGLYKPSGVDITSGGQKLEIIVREVTADDDHA